MSDGTTKTDEEWRRQLTADQFSVCRGKGTERAFSGAYWDHKAPGTYRCACCGAPLFGSDAKFDSGSGWPSFWQPLAAERMSEITDGSHGMVRTEVTCAACDSHLGHVFPDGPQPTGLRYCINSLSLDFDSADGQEENTE
ncbi:MAG: peptide-methionine (R)-S-oxide reductase MsrB [Alphaproteobacteria bacterium]